MADYQFREVTLYDMSVTFAENQEPEDQEAFLKGCAGTVQEALFLHEMCIRDRSEAAAASAATPPGKQDFSSTGVSCSYLLSFGETWPAHSFVHLGASHRPLLELTYLYTILPQKSTK